MVEMWRDRVDAAPEVHVVREPEHPLPEVVGDGEPVQGVAPQRVHLALEEKVGHAEKNCFITTDPTHIQH